MHAHPELRIGVTGHRSMADEPAVGDAVDAQLDTVLDAVLDAGAETLGTVHLVVVSALADGADRLVAHRVLARPGARLRAILPFPAASYEQDFGAASRAEFRSLLDRAAEITVVDAPAGDRDAAYLAAGLAVVAGCDVLFALWDGDAARGAGGTADVVAHARAAGVRTTVIPVRRATA